MEESEKRKERLKAMRMEAAQAGLHSEAGNSVGVFQSLTNPLIEPSASSSMPADSRASPRFDFYTDPMAAFSANKRGSKVSHQNTPDYFTSPSNSIFLIFYLLDKMDNSLVICFHFSLQFTLLVSLPKKCCICVLSN